MLAVTALCAAACSWFGVTAKQARNQRVAVEAFAQSHGRAYYDYEVDDCGQPSTNASPSEPTWLLNLLGKDFFHNVVKADVEFRFGIGISERNVTYELNDAGIVHLKSFDKLVWLDLADTSVSDEGMIHLRSLTHLKSLNLGDTAVTDQGLAHLKRLGSLEDLTLHRATEFSDAGLSHIKELPNLRHLNLTGTRVTDRGLRELVCIPTLETLYLYSTAVSDEGVRWFVERMPHVRVGHDKEHGHFEVLERFGVDLESKLDQ